MCIYDHFSYPKIFYFSIGIIFKDTGGLLRRWCGGLSRRCGGLVVGVPASRPPVPGSNLNYGGLPKNIYG